MTDDCFPIPSAVGLYDPADEHDACGVGFVAEISGKRSRRVVDAAIEALGAVWHRGAVDADGLTGDGAGIQVDIPQGFFKEHVERTGHEASEDTIAVGQVFLPGTDMQAQETCRTLVESEIIRKGFMVFGWRQVPVDTSVIGPKGERMRPEIEQIMVGNSRGFSATELERVLYVVRRRIETRVRAAGINDFYICSLSAQSIVYKGLFLAEHLATFYPDLKDSRFISRYAIYHQRYSTNTFPQWWLAQPFRNLAHNGEINTIRGNKNWMKSHEKRMLARGSFDDAEDVIPVIQPGASDSSALDAVFELMVRAGRSAPRAKTQLIPDAWSKARDMPKAHRDMYAYLNSVMEPWDGPAAIAATDGRWVLGGMDRGGLRPMRYVRTTDDLLIAGSETGMVQLDDDRVAERGRLGPGEMIAVDLEAGAFLHDQQIKDELAAAAPYGELVAKHQNFNDIDTQHIADPGQLYSAEDLTRRQLAAGMSREDLELILDPQARDGKEAIGSMGDDTPLAVVSENRRNLSQFFRQNFSQVTNPPIDPLRETRMMSLNTRFFNFTNLLQDDPRRRDIDDPVLVLDSPVITCREWGVLKSMFTDRAAELDCLFPADSYDNPLALTRALDALREQAEFAVQAGRGQLFLTDEKVNQDQAAIPMIIATAAVHSHLVKKGLRSYASINVRCAQAWDPHAFAVLIGSGATTVNAYLAEMSLRDRHARGLFGEMPVAEILERHRNAINLGLLKILSKMGVSVISSYRGGYNFEALGLSRALVDELFPGMPSKLSGIGLYGVMLNALEQHEKAFSDNVVRLPVGGFYRYRAGGEPHAFDGRLIHMLQKAVRDESYSTYKRYSTALGEMTPVNLRDLLAFKSLGEALPLADVESTTSLRKRFVTPGMSLGALSPIAHETLTIAMNQIGAKSVSGEGGEDPARFHPRENGDNPNSPIKQIASARFGVTAAYLNHCEEIEIKIAQGAKPGEGGQLPGFKVTAEIARLRHATEGVTLISPPPHHDIYSIEDLAQLIYDLKQINPTARVCVKLVSSAGIGTIAAGVAKAHADVILISGHSGGTGASPQTSIKYAGTPWEMGLAEVNQVLSLNGLRHKIKLRTDGGIKTGRDVVIAALLGAEEFGIGTTSLIAMGCIMVRQCHSNTCPVGICTQNPKLIEKFSGTPEKVVNLFTFIAEEVREILAELGAESLKQIIGRTDLLRQVSRGAPHLDDLDLNPLLVRINIPDDKRICTVKGRNEVPPALDDKMIEDAAPVFARGEKMQLSYAVSNTDRAIGTRFSSEIVRRFEEGELPNEHVTIKLRGTAGQSLGAFAVRGLRIEMVGDANDYVGKGLSGATIAIRPANIPGYQSASNTIIGNTVLYGATAGQLYAAGQAGERFAVRNSGADVVVEGCGANGCEYMTGGTAVILGPVGDNFAAGMTGGMAFVLDREDKFLSRLNPESAQAVRLKSRYWEAKLLALIAAHRHNTHSAHAEQILGDWPNSRMKFWQVCPLEMVDRLDHPLEDAVPAPGELPVALPHT
ncbi:MAG: glutamate synthase large subunit [Pseudomonadota bacterium]